LIARELGSIIIVPSDGFSADLEAYLTLDGVDEGEGGIADDGHVGRAMIVRRRMRSSWETASP
jgi:hypothetical protein